MRIDAHQHFWIYRKEEYPWISDEMNILQKDFLPSDLFALMQANGIEGTIAVQARQSEIETQWLLQLAENFSFILGVVGWVDLCAPDARDKIAVLAKNRKLKGLRHVLHDEADPDFMLRKEFLHGISFLNEHSLCYDLLIFPEHLANTIRLVKQFPEQTFILDHLGKPRIKSRIISPWKEQIQELASFPNVSCKLSGMVTEADIHHWKENDFENYLETVLTAFGPSRLMFGSDWPVCTLGGDYRSIRQIVLHYISRLSSAEQSQILGGNAARIYGLTE